MAAEGDVIVTYIFTGEEERDEDGFQIIPQNATHLIIHESITVIPAYLCHRHPNIVEVYCHAGVKRIESNAFNRCRRLRRIIIPGVEVVERSAFEDCEAVNYVECPKLERVKRLAFYSCKSLSNINLPSAKVVWESAFVHCPALTEAKFGKDLESIRDRAFSHCPSLESVTIPLKNGLFTAENTFQCCDSLKSVDLVEREVLHETIAALLLEEWRNDINGVMDSINQILLNADPGHDVYFDFDDGDKAGEIRRWITRVLQKIIHYKVQHRHVLNEAATTLRITLPNEIVTSNVMPFLELPEYTFEGEGDDTM